MSQFVESHGTDGATGGRVAPLVAQGCDGIVAGCTEIELLVTPDDVAVPYFPTTRLHALAVVDAALAP